MPAKHPKKPAYRFTQGDFGLYIIRDKSGSEITIDCKNLSMSDIRELLKGMGNIMRFISNIRGIGSLSKVLSYYQVLSKSTTVYQCAIRT